MHVDVREREGEYIDPMSTSVTHNTASCNNNKNLTNSLLSRTWLSYIFHYIWNQVSLLYPWNVSTN